MKKYIFTLLAATVATTAMAQSHEHTWIGGTTAADGHSCTLKCIDPECTAEEHHSHDGLEGCEYCGWALDLFNLKVRYTNSASTTVTEEFLLKGADIKFSGAYAFDHYNHIMLDAIGAHYNPENAVDFKDIASITGDAGYGLFRISTSTKGNLDYQCRVGKTSTFRFWVNPEAQDVPRLFSVHPALPEEDMIYSHSAKEMVVEKNEYSAGKNPTGIKEIGTYADAQTYYTTDAAGEHRVTPAEFVDAGTYYCWGTTSVYTGATRYLPLQNAMIGTFEIAKAEPVKGTPEGEEELSRLYIYTAPAAEATRQWTAEGVKTVEPFIEYNAARHDAQAAQDLSFSTGLGDITLVYTTDAAGEKPQDPTAAGHYYVWAKTAEGKNYKALAPYRIGDFEVVKATVEGDARKALFKYTEQNYVYNDTEHRAVLAPADGIVGLGTLTDAYKMTSDHATAVEHPIDAMTYDLWVGAELGTNYFPVEPVLLREMFIDRARPTTDAERRAVMKYVAENFVYDATAKTQTVTVADGIRKLGTVKWTYKQGEAVVAAPTNAGTYDVWANAELGDNYYAVAPVKMGSFDITRRPVTDAAELATLFTYTQPADDAIMYDATAKGVSVTKASAIVGLGTVSVSYKAEGSTGDFVTPVNAGWYDVYATTADDGQNYKATGAYKVGKFHVDKAHDLTAEQRKALYAATNLSHVYDATAKAATVTKAAAVNGLGAITVAYKQGGDDVAAPTDANTYDVIASTAEGANYYAQPAVKVADLFIDKATLTTDEERRAVMKYVAENFVYDATAKTQTVTVADGISKLGTVKWTYKQGDAVVAAPTNAGTYDVWANAEQGDNYYAVAPVKMGSFEISRRPVTEAAELATLFSYTQPADDAIAYSATAKGVTVTSAPGIVGLGTINLSYKAEGSTGDYVTPINAGWYDVYASTADDGQNYKATAVYKVGKFHIDKATVTTANWQDFFSLEMLEGYDVYPWEKVKNPPYFFQPVRLNTNPGVEGVGYVEVLYTTASETTTAYLREAGTYGINILWPYGEGENFYEANVKTGQTITIAKADLPADVFAGQCIALFLNGGSSQVTYTGESFVPSVRAAHDGLAGSEIEFYVEKDGVRYDAIVDAGKYDVWVRTSGGSSFNPIGWTKSSRQFTIYKKGNYTSTDLVDLVAPYPVFTGLPKQARVEPKAGIHGLGEASFSYTTMEGRKATPTQPGQYKVLMTLAEGANYTAAAYPREIGTITITENSIGEVTKFINALLNDEIVWGMDIDNDGNVDAKDVEILSGALLK